MGPEPATLNEIGLTFGTDKSSAHHDYLAFYESHFEPLRNKPIKLLEIGVLNGASLRTWEAYFPHASLVGADIDRRTLQHATARASVEIIDQSNLQNLVDLGMRHGPFDIVIEDGSHQWEHQVTTLKTLFPFVKDGGIYVVEDLHTSYGDLAKQFQGVATSTPVEYLTRLLHYHIGDEQTEPGEDEDPFLRTYGRAIETMAFYRHICLLKKTRHRVSPWLQGFTANPLIQVKGEYLFRPFQLVAELEGVGEVATQDTLFVGTDAQQPHFIQGFTLAIIEPLADEVSIRVRQADGAWTEWLPGNRFAGERGGTDHLTGYAVMLSGRLEATYDIHLAGVFGISAELVIVGNGEDCAPAEAAPLRGMQMIVRNR